MFFLFLFTFAVLTGLYGEYNHANSKLVRNIDYGKFRKSASDIADNAKNHNFGGLY